MPIDPFKNARPYYDVTFPSSGDGLSIANLKNSMQGLGFLDFIMGQPRAHSPADLKIMVRGRDASSFFNPIYAGDADAHVFFSSGDSTAMVAPVSNPRLDIVYLTPSGDIRIVTGAEAATPTLPSLSPSGDSRIPICAVYHKTTETKIVNFEDRNSNTGDGYIYQDLRPFLRAHGFGGVTLTATTPVAGMSGDVVGTATTAARADHTHQAVHAIRVVGQTNLKGDVEFAGAVTQAGNRISTLAATQAQMEAAAFNEAMATPANVNWHPGVAKAWVNFNGTGTPAVVTSYNTDSSITDNGVGDYTLSWTTDFSSANYVLAGWTWDPAPNYTFITSGTSGLAAGTARILIMQHNGSASDNATITVVAFGDQ